MPSVEPGLVRCCSGMVRVWVLAELEEELSAPTFASPKSRILACPRSVTKMLAALMSRWTIPLPCAASSASATSMARGSRISRSRGRPAMRCFRVTPSRYSMAMKARSFSSPMSWMVQMLG